jgi:competence protein ComGF
MNFIELKLNNDFDRREGYVIMIYMVTSFTIFTYAYVYAVNVQTNSDGKNEIAALWLAIINWITISAYSVLSSTTILLLSIITSLPYIKHIFKKDIFTDITSTFDMLIGYGGGKLASATRVKGWMQLRVWLTFFIIITVHVIIGITLPILQNLNTMQTTIRSSSIQQSASIMSSIDYNTNGSICGVTEELQRCIIYGVNTIGESIKLCYLDDRAYLNVNNYLSQLIYIIR